MDFKSIPIQNPGERPVIHKGALIPKTALNLNNAIKYLPFFTRALDTFGSQEMFVSAKSAGYKVETLQNRLAEALRFLTIQPMKDCKYTPEDFIRLKKRVKFYKVQYGDDVGVMMRYTKVGISIEDHIVSLDIGLNADPIWKIKVNEFINDDNMQHLLLEGTQQLGYMLTADDIEWVKRTFVQLDIEHTVEPHKIQALK